MRKLRFLGLVMGLLALLAGSAAASEETHCYIVGDNCIIISNVCFLESVDCGDGSTWESEMMWRRGWCAAAIYAGVIVGTIDQCMDGTARTVAEKVLISSVSAYFSAQTGGQSSLNGNDRQSNSNGNNQQQSNQQRSNQQQRQGNQQQPGNQQQQGEQPPQNEPPLQDNNDNNPPPDDGVVIQVIKQELPQPEEPQYQQQQQGAGGDQGPQGEQGEKKIYYCDDNSAEALRHRNSGYGCSRRSKQAVVDVRVNRPSTVTGTMDSDKPDYIPRTPAQGTCNHGAGCPTKCGWSQVKSISGNNVLTKVVWRYVCRP